MKIRPAHPGLIVRDPYTKRPLSEDGDDVAEDSYWLRRLRSGDVVLVEEHAPLATAKKGRE